MSESKEVQKPQECSIHIDSIVRIIVGKTVQLGSDTRAGFEDWYRRNYKASDTKESITRKAYDQPIVVISAGEDGCVPSFMEEARGIAAQCWCDDETKHIEMDVVLAEAIAKRIALWVETAAQNQRNTEFYRGLVERCGRAIGKRAFTQDDGGICDNVLCIKVPEIIENDYTRHGT